MWRQVYVRLRSLWRWRRQESELDAEIRFHLSEETDERIAAGLPREQARAAARRDFGNVPLVRELTRETWGWGAAERLWQDARSAVRMMRRNPGYTCAVVVTLALGIGLNAAMYGLLSRLFLQAPPHIADPDGIHRVYVRQRNVFSGRLSTRNQMEWSEFRALRADTAGIAAVAGSTYPRAMPNGRGQAAENLHVAWVDGGFFPLLGVRPALGRLIGPEDDDLATTPVALIGDRYARRRFGQPREALGATVSFDDVTYEIVGVLPPGFSGPDPSAADVWLPLQIALPASRGAWAFRSGFSLMPFVRLAPGVTAQAAGAAATTVLRASRADSPTADRLDAEATLLLGPLLMNRGPSDIAGNLHLPLVVGGVALIVLLVAVANVTNLLMLRVASRRRELAVRSALGAGRWAVGRLLVIESVLLAALSGVAALAVAAATGRALRLTLLPSYNWAGGPVDVPLMAFTGGTVLLVGLAAALAPALYAARARGVDRLDGLHGARAGSPVRSGLIVVQAALSVVLLVGGALFLRSFEAARRVDIGYAKENVLTVNLVGGGSSLRNLMNETPVDETAALTMEARVRAMPGVVEVVQATSTPLHSRRAIYLGVDGLDDNPFREGPYVSFVTPGFFRVAGLAIREGRGFAESDRAGARKVAVVNTAFARQTWPGARAIGRCLFVGSDAGDCATVVGVVETPLERGLEADDIVQYYLPFAQAASDPATSDTARSQRALVVRTRGDPERMVGPVLLALAEVFPDLPRSNVQSLPAALAPHLRTWRIGTALFGAAALLALLLAAVGLYAVIAFGVRQRELEFGIRRALGAQPWHLLSMVLARGLGLVAAGVAAGALASFWAGRFVAPLLFDGRSARDPLAFTAAALVLLSVALAASFPPARRAALADPRQALQAE